MAGLVQGRIIRALVSDPRGLNPKIRPLVIATATSEIPAASTVVAAAITSQFVHPLDEDEVLLPWHRDGYVVTKLKKPCVAKCSWLCTIKKSEVVEEAGIVPKAVMEQILEIISNL